MWDYNRDGKTDGWDYAAEHEDLRRYNEALGNGDNDTQTPEEWQEVKGIAMFGKPIYERENDSDGVTILKSLAVIGICIGGFILAINTESLFAMAACLLGAVALGVAIFKL